MKKLNFQEIIETPSNCQVTLDDGVLTVKGEKGDVRKNLFDPAISLKLENNNINISTKNLNKRKKKLMNTYKAHIKNLFKGVSVGHTYKLKICSGHFPMTVSVKDDLFEIKNFLGEKVPRKLKILEGTEVRVDGTEVVVESVSKEKAGQMAASIEQLTRRPGFDKRIFQDGIYIIEKDGKVVK
ncbi:MAG: 50S ribosomal protein L6 [DPANN group archaeon]|nr:50S ribosomal protein L6 [DPANN group archaeon]